MTKQPQENVAQADVDFLRYTGLALVILTLLTGSISLVGAVSVLPIESPSAAYGVNSPTD